MLKNVRELQFPRFAAVLQIIFFLERSIKNDIYGTCAVNCWASGSVAYPKSEVTLSWYIFKRKPQIYATILSFFISRVVSYIYYTYQL
jgi:hypothetical protein